MNTSDIEDVRRSLRGTDPLRTDEFIGAAHDERGQYDLARIIATEPIRGRRVVLRDRFFGSRSRRRWSTVAGTVAVLVGLGAGATAAGLVPDGVVKGFHKGGSAPLEQVRTDKAVMAGQARLPSGTVWQLWIAPNKAGGDCVYTRTVAPGGKHEDGSLECSVAEARDTDPLQPIWISYKKLEGQYVVSLGVDMANAKSVKAKFGLDLTRARSMRVQLANGSAVTMPIIKGSSFDGPFASAPTSLDVVDANGRSLGHFTVKATDFCPENCQW